MHTVSAPTAPLSLPADPTRTDGRRIGVLLQHGFTGSPFSMKPWAEALAERGYAVEVPLLPGHATSWQDMNSTGWSDWLAEPTRAVEKLLAENDAVVLAGLSMGGALVLHLGSAYAGRVSGVIVVNPAVSSTRFDVKLLPVLKHLVGGFPAIANDIKKQGVDEHGYPKTPLKAAHSMMKAWPGVVRELGKLTAPVLYLRSTEDHVVDESSEPLILENLGSTDVTVVRLEDSYHVATLDNDLPVIIAESVAFIERVTAI